MAALFTGKTSRDEEKIARGLADKSRYNAELETLRQQERDHRNAGRSDDHEEVQKLVTQIAEKETQLKNAEANLVFNGYRGDKDPIHQSEETEAKEEQEREKEHKESTGEEKKIRKDLENASRGGGGSNAAENRLGLFVFLAIFAHVVDAFTGFDVIYSKVVIAIYAIMILLAGFEAKGRIANIAEFITVAVLAYAVPRVLTLFKIASWEYTILGFILLFPLMALYLSLRMPPESKWRKFVVGYIIFWCIIALIWLLINFNTVSGNTKIPNPLKILDYVLQGTGKVLNSGTTVLTKSFQMAIAQATGQQYAGQEENQRGIFLENLRPIDTLFYTDSNIIVEAKIRAQNIPGTIQVRNICLVPGVRTGNTTPAVMQLANNDANTIDCDLGTIPKEGSYEVKFISTFTYETDADVTYTFMNRNAYRLLDTDNTGNINAKLGIQDTALAVYTGGPAALGLPQLHQPIQIDPTNPNEIQYPFGVSLTNMWPRGTIVKGMQYTLQVPDSIELEKCTRDITSESIADGIHTYIFAINDANVRSTFDSVTCRIKVVNTDQLLGAGVKSEKTFSAKAIYQYSVEESVYVMVQQWYGDIQRQNALQNGVYP